MADISTFFKTVALPVMPEVGLALIATLDDDDAPASKIQGLIAQDPVLTAKLLALANSAAFGLPRKVASLDTAMSLVGLSKLRTLALSACLHNAFSVPEGIDSTTFWRYSLDCAGYAQWLCGGLDDNLDVDHQKAWLAGLMLRLGELIIGQAVPEVMAQIEARPSQPGERWEREKALAGFDEGEVTAALAHRWNFPSDVVHALLFASNPLVEKPLTPLAGVLHLAGRLADVPDADATAIDGLPVPVMAALALKYGWMTADFPDPGSFVDIGSLTGK
ncbi:MAG: HDOD domain-containing protein [Rhodoferax sp.]|nr:HDOD domain-containing protein [Rhodoferax sp.]